MTDLTFNQRIQRYEMAQAYVAITDQMGPNAQLLAFVNYMNVTNDSLGLESFDIVSQHEKVLADIEANGDLALLVSLYIADPSQYQMDSIATEGFVSKLLLKVFGRVNNYGAWISAKRYAALVMDSSKRRITSAPTSTSLAAWEKYEKDDEAALVAVNKEVDAINKAKLSDPKNNHDDKVTFGKSGWTKERYDAEMKWADQLEKSNVAFIKANEAKIEKLLELEKRADDSDDSDEVKAAKIMRRVNGQLKGTIDDLKNAHVRARSFLAGIAKHID